ncbi:MAG: hypothetical protein MJ025_05775 [Victivallaceae bacterium]|nr:hypothetical protein [Victivallaceae bacterium]
MSDKRKNVHHRNPRFESPLGFVGRSAHPDIVCKGCIFSMGSEPHSDRYDKAYCIEYPYGGEYGSKPNSVYYDGGPCEYRKSLQEWFGELSKEKQEELAAKLLPDDDNDKGKSR